MNNLALLHEVAAKYEQAESLWRKLLASHGGRSREPSQPEPSAHRSDQMSAKATLLAGLGQCLLKQEKYVEAEMVLRQCLDIRANEIPDDWRRYDSMSQLGGCLLAQERFSEAESLIAEGYEGMQARAATSPSYGDLRLADALQRMVRFNLARGDTRQARLRGWRGDLDALVTLLKHKQWQVYFKVKPEVFQEAVTRLHEKIPTLKDHEILVEMLKITALTGDQYTTLWPRGKKFTFRRYPIRFVWASDGLFVDAATSQHQSLLRAKVVGIGKLSLDEVLDRVSTLREIDNPSAAKHDALRRLNQAEVLAALGIVQEMTSAPFTIVDASGQQQKVFLSPLDAEANPRFLYAFDAAGNDVPASRRRPRARYENQWLGDTRTLFCWYDLCRDLPDRPVSSWCQQVLDEIDAKPVERVVLDLRRNPGGSSSLLKPLIDGIAAREGINRKGHLFVLIDRGTAGSATLNAHELRKRMGAILVGMPAGGSLNTPGEQKYAALPYSGWRLQYSTKWIGVTEDSTTSILRNFGLEVPNYLGFRQDSTNILAPDITVEWSSDDYFAGRDPVLEAALKYEP